MSKKPRRLLFAPLLPLSWLYSAGLAAYLLPYKLGIRKKHRLACRVISVGNLTFGGTGKSPTVRALCEGLVKRGLKPAVLSRGHGGQLCTVGAIVSDGNKRFLDAVDCGDEPAALADALPGVPVAIGKDRVKVGKMLIEQFAPDIIVLDDGMQYWQLHRDVEMVLVRADDPFGTGWALPAGNLREPIGGIKRADVVLVTGTETTGDEEANRLANSLSKRVPKARVFKAKKTPKSLIDCLTGDRLAVSTLEGKSVVAVSGIASPESFKRLVLDCKVDVKKWFFFGDHCSYSEKQVEEIKHSLSQTGAKAVITTAKDAVKLRLENMYVLDIDIMINNLDNLLDLIAGKARG